MAGYHACDSWSVSLPFLFIASTFLHSLQNWLSEPSCGDTYVGKSKQSLRDRIKQHRRPSSNEAQNLAVYNHCNGTEHFFNPDQVIVLDK